MPILSCWLLRFFLFVTRVLFLTGTLAVLPPGQNGVVQDGNPIAWIRKEINLHDMECSMYSLHVINKLKSREKVCKTAWSFWPKEDVSFSFSLTRLLSSYWHTQKKFLQLKCNTFLFNTHCCYTSFFQLALNLLVLIFSWKQRRMFTEVFFIRKIVLFFFFTKKKRKAKGRSLQPA